MPNESSQPELASRPLTPEELDHLRAAWYAPLRRVPILWAFGGIVSGAVALFSQVWGLLIVAGFFGFLFWVCSSRLRYIEADLNAGTVVQLEGAIEKQTPQYSFALARFSYPVSVGGAKLFAEHDMFHGLPDRELEIQKLFVDAEECAGFVVDCLPRSGIIVGIQPKKLGE